MPAQEARKSLLALLVDQFVHPRLRVDTDIYFRARILIAAMLSFCLVTSTAFIAVLITPFMARSVFWASLILLPATLIFAILLHILRTHGRYMFCSIGSVSMVYFMIVVGVMVSGGPSASPVIQLFVIPPLTAYFFGGLLWGGRAVLVCVLTLLVLIALEFFGVHFLQTVGNESQMELARAITIALNLAVISGMAFIYEFTAAVLKRERDIEHDKYVLLAKTDPLTGLANRRNFDAVLQERVELYAAQNPPRRFALGYLDLDGFKPINDQHGHAVGDEVLRVIADRLQAALRGTDFVCRHGGDEFLLLLDLVGSQAILEAMADRLLASIAQPIATSVGILQVTGSLGFALFPLDAADINELMKAADAAMYKAKQQRGSWRFYKQA